MSSLRCCRSLLFLSLTAALVVGAGVGCATGDGTPQPDTAEPDTAEPDAAEPSSSEPDTGEPDAAPEFDPATFAFAADDVDIYVGTEDDGSLLWLVESFDTNSNALLLIEVFESFGAPTSPSTVSLTAAEGDYASCATCIILETGCDDAGFNCSRTWMPHPEGNVRFDAMGVHPDETFAGELVDVRFREVRIAEDFTTTEVGSDDALVVDSFAFEAALQAL